MDTGDQIVRYEINVTPVAFWPFAVFGERARQRAFVKRHPRNHRDIHLNARGEKIVFRILIEDVVDHLHRINQSAAHRAHTIPGLPAIDTDAYSLN